MNEMLAVAGETPEAAPKKRVLLIDDYPPIRQLLARLLTEEGYRVEAELMSVEEIERINPAVDLVLLDPNRPYEEECDFFQQLCARCPSLPVILLTAAPRSYFSSKPTGLGVWLEKPLDFVKLFETIHGFLEGRRAGWLARVMDPPLVGASEADK